jgi:RHS repeat-associated protein
LSKVNTKQGEIKNFINGSFMKSFLSHFESSITALNSYLQKKLGLHLLTFTGEEGNILYEQNFDAWGRYRNIKDWSYVGLPGRPRWLYRGYTGHEHLEQQDLDTGFFELINMNGRLYDPINGRMLSPDNLIHDDAGTQGYNRYSYAHNNPLKFTDPDGNEPTILGAMAIGAGIGVVMNGIGNLQNGQNFWKGAGDAALMGAVQGASSFGIGGAATGFLSQAVEHGLVGGFFSYAQGGTFKSGFISGAFSSVVSSGIANLNLPKGAYVAATLAAGGITGGLSSRLSGGTFVDGARNGIITAGLNHLMHAVQSYKDGPGDPPSYTIVSSGLNLSWSLGFGGGEFGVGTVSDGNDFALYFSGTQKGQWFNFGADGSISVAGMISTDGQPLTLDGSFAGESQKVFYSGGILGKGSASILSNPGQFGKFYTGIEVGGGGGFNALPYSYGYGGIKTRIWKFPRFSFPIPTNSMSPVNKYTNPFYGPKL